MAEQDKKLKDIAEQKAKQEKEFDQKLEQQENRLMKRMEMFLATPMAGLAPNIALPPEPEEQPEVLEQAYATPAFSPSR